MPFAPPAGPPPVPEGWTTQFDDRYGAWYVPEKTFTSDNRLTIS